MDEARFLVYEVVNFDAAEIEIGVARADVQPDQVVKEAGARLGWRSLERATFRVVEADLSRETAAQFARRYGKSTALRAFRVVLADDKSGAGRA